jgi:alpha-1,3-mannosyltransferase
MPIKVAHVVRQYYPSVGGMEEVVQNIARHQRDYHGHVPTIFTLNRLFRNSSEALPSEDEVDGIRVVRLPYRGSSRYPLAPQVLREVRDADVIHVHGVDFFYDYLALTKAVHRRPLVASTHGGFFHTQFASRLKTIYFNTITRASSAAYDRIVGTSENDGVMFRDIVRPPKLSVIENGVNVQKFAGRGAARLAPVMIYFGRWSVNKGLIETLALFRELVARHPEWRLIVAGREYDHTVTELQALIEQHGLIGKVQLAANPAERELAELIGQASYYVCLSRHEGFGIAPIEAMSAGLTPVLSDIPPFRNLVEKSGMGVLVDTQQLEQAATQIADLHAQGEEAYAARRSAAQHFVQQYDWRHIADRYVQIYQDLVGGERVTRYV